MSDAEDRGMELIRQAAMQRGATARAVANANTPTIGMSKPVRFSKENINVHKKI